MAQGKTFIEVQFPVSKVSKESYKERKAGSGQTLTGLGKWWGRKPLVLVRATILGLLMPASNDPHKDMDIFLKIMSMDKNGLLNRKTESIPAKAAFEMLTIREREQYFSSQDGKTTTKWKTGIKAAEKTTVLEKAWNRMSYDQKLNYCVGTKEYKNESPELWREINTHLGTYATNVQELIKQLGLNKFGHNAVVGDCFCGGGSVPFEAARLGCDVFASDLNPIAALLTYSSLNILSSSDHDIKRIKEFQNQVFDEVKKEIDLMGIEVNDEGKRSHFYIYCVEATCPECGCVVPLSSNWIISKHKNIVANLKYNRKEHNFDIDIIQNATKENFKLAREQITLQKNKLICLNCSKKIPIQALREDRKNEIVYGLRQWEKNEFIPRDTDVFRDRLYCVKYFNKFDNRTWEETIKRPAAATDASFGQVEYRTPSEEDLRKEQLIVDVLSEKFSNWQEKGYIPCGEIEEGEKTRELMRTRGWKFWHQIFNPRQLLTNGLFIEKTIELAKSKDEVIIGLLGINKIVDRNSKLCIWHVMDKQEKGENTFYNQALNTLYNYTTRSLSTLFPTWYLNLKNTEFHSNNITTTLDARNVTHQCDLWITDPPYADAVNYHELSEFFLAWDKKPIKIAFPEWYADSKRVLAVSGRDEVFNNSMIAIYTNLTKHMPNDGLQIIMFTHQDVSVWADLALIVWSAGLQVVAAWNIATETESGGLKEGNYVKGTVLLVLRKQNSTETAYLDELYPDIEEEVKRQINSMHSLDDKEEPNFSDADYILAAYAAALKVLTSLKQIEDIDVQYELSRERKKGELSPIAKLIESATKIAYDQLIPNEFDNFIWRSLNPDERLYIKGLELEKNNIYQVSAYQELARGFGVANYKDLMENTKANTARFKTGSEWANRNIGGDGKFSSSLLRHVLMATYIASKEENNVQAGKNWIRNEVNDYWNKRERICELLKYIVSFESIENMAHWHEEAVVANILKELVANDGI